MRNDPAAVIDGAEALYLFFHNHLTRHDLEHNGDLVHNTMILY